jgi:ribosomal protein S18 acetylase RimI-like enzyme
MEISSLQNDHIFEIRPLWQGLNSLHGKLSTNFKDHYQNFTFDKRIKNLLKKDALKVFVAKENDSYIGYCIASVQDAVGEIDSIFVLPEFRECKAGYKLMESALKWLQVQVCDYIDLIIAEGNEGVISFYEQFGFRKRATIMRLKKD